MASGDYIPKKDGDLVPWMENFIAVANANLVALGLFTSDIGPPTTKKSTYSTNLNNAIAAQSASKSATDNKNLSKDALVNNARTLVRQIQGKVGVPDYLIEELGLNVHGSSRSHINPVAPTNLSASSVTGGANRLKWDRNGNPNGVIFLIQTSNNPGGPWTLFASTTKCTFDFVNPHPLAQNYIQVFAQNGKKISIPSNVIVI
jgi:hypothetical protein